MTKPAFPIMIRTGAVALLLAASAFAGAAYAGDEYGTNRETVVRQAAASPGANLGTSLASSVSIVSTRSDVVGAGGPQDTLARLIHHPGSGTDW